MLTRPPAAQSCRSNQVFFYCEKKYCKYKKGLGNAHQVDAQSHMLPSSDQHIKRVLQDNTLKLIAANRRQQEVAHVPSAIFRQVFTTLA
jgi:hypothetical protein